MTSILLAIIWSLLFWPWARDIIISITNFLWTIGMHSDGINMTRRNGSSPDASTSVSPATYENSPITRSKREYWRWSSKSWKRSKIRWSGPLHPASYQSFVGIGVSFSMWMSLSFRWNILYSPRRIEDTHTYSHFGFHPRCFDIHRRASRRKGAPHEEHREGYDSRLLWRHILTFSCCA